MPTKSPQEFLRQRRKWGIVAWLVLGTFLGGAFVVSDAIAGRITSIPFVVVQGFLCAALWIVAAPWIWRLAGRFPVISSRWVTGLATHLMASVAFSALLTTAFAALFWGLHGVWVGTDFGFTNALRVSSYYFFLAKTMFYWLVVVARIAFDQAALIEEERLHASRMKEQLTEARLTVLRMQMSPHFLFNSLHAVSGLIRGNQGEKALGILGRLGDFLRGSLDSKEEGEASLEAELQALDHYLEIERCRFEDRLQVRLEVDDALRVVSFPRWVLQPLVENAIVHGVEQRAAGGSVVLRVREDHGDLVVEVEDDGPGVSPEARERIGWGNTRSRLRELYGERFSMTASVPETGGTRVTLRWPLEPIGSAGELLVSGKDAS